MECSDKKKMCAQVADVNKLLPCKLTFGYLSDEVYNQSSFCLTVVQNSVSLKNFGTTADIVEKYPYSDIAGKRYGSEELQYFARLEDRSREGGLHVCRPPMYTEGPVIATMIHQYGIGRPIDENNIGKRMLQNCKDTAVISRLEEDTTENRIIYFNRSMFKLAVELSKPENDYIKKILIPVGLGRRCLDDVWLKKYAPVISVFAKDMDSRGKEVVLVVGKRYFEFLEKNYKTNTDHQASAYFENLKSLPVLSKDDLSLDKTLPYGEYEEEGDNHSMMMQYILD